MLVPGVKMSLISLQHVSHNFGDRDIFKDVSFSIEKNSRIGLVGVNGSGKTTLFNILTGSIIPAAGLVQKAKNLKIAFLSQEVDLPEDETLHQYMITARPEFLLVREKLQAVELELQRSHHQEDLENYLKVQQEFEFTGGFEYDTEIKLVLTSLAFPENIWHKTIREFSGGEKTRIQLARFLLQSFDLLLLDEPTNHLDITMIMWLEKYLFNLGRPYVIISHDRHFLDNTISKIAEIADFKINVFHTNFTNYLLERDLRLTVQAREFKRQQKFIRQTEDFIQRNMAGQKVNQARSRLKQLDKLEVMEKPRARQDIKLPLKSSKRSGNDVFVFQNLTLGYPDKALARTEELRVGYQDKIAILGTNGCGKTTLLRLMNGELEPLQGRAKRGASLDIGYYDQLHLRLDDSKTVLRTIWDMVPDEPQGYALGYLARFGFRGDDVEKPVHILSGGEKSRLFLAKLIHEKPNFLILDEPTNHLDIFMVASLEKSLREYDGTVVFVSHDRYFVDKVATRKWFFNRQGIIEETTASLDDLFFARTSPPSRKESSRPEKIRRINPYLLEQKMKEIENLQAEIQQSHRTLESLSLQLTDRKTYNSDEKIKALTEEIAQAQASIDDQQKLLEGLEEEYLGMLDEGQ